MNSTANRNMQFSVVAEQYVRFSGETRYALRKIINPAIGRFVGFLYKSLQSAGYLGGAISIGSIISLILLLLIWLVKDVTCAGGWFFALPLIFLGHGIVLLFIGKLGACIGRIFDIRH